METKSCKTQYKSPEFEVFSVESEGVFCMSDVDNGAIEPGESDEI